MSQAKVPTIIEPMNRQPIRLKPVVPMELPEARYPQEPFEPIKVEETKVTIASEGMPEETTEATNEEESIPLLGTLEGIGSEEIPQVDL